MWGPTAEEWRADVLAFDADGSHRRIFASGLRNCTAEAIAPATGALWCVVNERDGLGDDLPPDFATSVREGAFYGWPWYYIGNHEDPRLKGQHPDLEGRVTIPDVLIQPHSAPLGITFYDGAQFPQDYRGDAFVTLRGSWNRARRTGYKVIRLRFANGRPTGEYEDFLTGFVVSDQAVWGRPVGIAVAHDGALLVSEDGNGTIWRIAYPGGNDPSTRPPEEKGVSPAIVTSTSSALTTGPLDAGRTRRRALVPDIWRRPIRMNWPITVTYSGSGPSTAAKPLPNAESRFWNAYFTPCVRIV